MDIPLTLTDCLGLMTCFKYLALNVKFNTKQQADEWKMSRNSHLLPVA